MIKYKYLYKEYILRIIILSFFLTILMFFQLGFRKRFDNLNNAYIVMLLDLFTSIELVVPLLLFDNYKETKFERIRSKNIFITHFEKLFITILIAISIRVLSCFIYNLIIFKNFDNYAFIFRFILVDIGTILIGYTLYNIFKNKYVSVVASFIFNILLFNYKWLHYTILQTNGEKFITNNYMIYFISIIIYLILFIISIIWRCEYVSD